MRKLFTRSRIACALIATIGFLAGGGTMVWRDYWTYAVLLDSYRYRNETRSSAAYFKEVVRPRFAADLRPQAPEEATFVSLPGPKQKELLRRPSRNRVCSEVRTATSRARICTFRP